MWLRQTKGYATVKHVVRGRGWSIPPPCLSINFISAPKPVWWPRCRFVNFSFVGVNLAVAVSVKLASLSFSLKFNSTPPPQKKACSQLPFNHGHQNHRCASLKFLSTWEDETTRKLIIKVAARKNTDVILFTLNSLLQFENHLMKLYFFPQNHKQTFDY